MNRVLVMDDEPAMGENIQRMLHSRDIMVKAFTNPKLGLEQALSEPPDLLLLDIKMPEMSGEEVFARLHEAHPNVPVVFLTAFGSIEGAVIAMRNGAFDYLQKPFKREDLLLAVKRGLAQRKLAQEVNSLRQRLEDLGETDTIQSHSPAMQEQLEKARRAAATDATIMILGESGTGKEVMARFIHGHSQRGSGPFVPVDCSAMPGSLIESELFGYERGAFTGADRTKKGLIESSQEGTLFLDEIGDLSVELQTRLFRFVEERELRRLGGLQPVKIDCRILCATNQDLTTKIKAGTFREELYYRLGVVIITLPSMRERLEDIPYLANFFLERFSRRYGKSLSASPDFQEALLTMPWPGNVRELKNLMERLTALHADGVLRACDVAHEATAGEIAENLSLLPWKDAREKYLGDFELSYARTLLSRCGGNISAAAREAAVDRKTFYALLGRDHAAQVGE
jgi:two-component system response regulator AtoC